VCCWTHIPMISKELTYFSSYSKHIMLDLKSVQAVDGTTEGSNSLSSGRDLDNKTTHGRTLLMSKPQMS